MIPWYFWLLVSLGGYLLIGGVHTWIAVKTSPNRWTNDWFSSSRSAQSIDPLAVRFVFWLWPAMTLGILGYCVFLIFARFFGLADSIMRLAKPANVRVYKPGVRW